MQKQRLTYLSLRLYSKVVEILIASSFGGELRHLGTELGLCFRTSRG